MLIAVDYNAALRQIAGIGRYSRELVRSFHALGSGDELVLFYAANDLPPTGWGLAHLRQLLEAAPNIRAVALPFTERTLTILWQRVRLPLAVERWTGPVDIVHAPDFVLPPVRHARTLATVHDLTFRVHPETAFPKLRRYLNSAVPRTLRRADGLIAVSESTSRDLQRLMSVPPTKITVIEHGIGPEFQRVTAAATLERVRQRYGLDAPFFLHVGTIEPRKNLARLMTAFSQLAADRPFELLLAGKSGWLAEPLLAQARATPGVRLLGPVDEADLPALYTLAYAVVYPSLYEGFGFPAVEALACGTAVITSNTSSLPEVVGNAALLVNPHATDELRTALQRLADEPGLTTLAQRTGPQQTARFRWERAAQSLLKVYHGLA